MIAMWDQVKAALRDMAPTLWNYLQDLQNLGFTREEAFLLVRDVQNRMVSDKDSR